MKTEILMRKSGNALLPASNYDQELLDEIHSERAMVVEIHQVRNPQFLRKYWALASAVSRFDKHFHDAREADRWVRRQIPNMHRRYLEHDGTLVIEYQSIAMGNMDETAFSNFYDRALYLWAERIGTDPETLLQETIPVPVPKAS